MCDPGTAAIVGATAMGVGTVGNLAMGYQAQQNSKGLLKSQKALTDAQGTLARDQAIAYENYFMPVEAQLAGEAQAGVPVEYEEARAGIDTRRAFDQSVGQQRREMSRYGIDMSSPKFANLDSNLALIRAAAEAGAKTGVRNQARQLNWDRRMQTAQLGRGIAGSAASGLNSAAGGYGSMAGTQMGIAGQYGQQAGQFAQLGTTLAMMNAKAPTSNNSNGIYLAAPAGYDYLTSPAGTGSLATYTPIQ